MLSADIFYNLLMVTLFAMDTTEGSVHDAMRLIRINNPKKDSGTSTHKFSALEVRWNHGCCNHQLGYYFRF